MRGTADGMDAADKGDDVILQSSDLEEERVSLSLADLR